jgi:hypothetical protein
MSYFLRIEETCILISKKGGSREKILRISYEFEIVFVYLTFRIKYN